MLKAIFIPDARDMFTGAQCELPSGEVVEVKARNTPFFALCRELEARGYGDCHIEISTPTGTPSMRSAVGVAAGLAVSERDGRGHRLEKYRPFPVRGRPTGAQVTPLGSSAPESEEMPASDSTAHEEAA